MSAALVNPTPDEMAQAAYEMGLIDVPDSLSNRPDFRLGYFYEEATPRPVLIEKRDYRPKGYFYAVWRNGYAVYESGEWVVHDNIPLLARLWHRFTTWL